MQVSVHAVGKRMPAWVEQGVADYSKRLPTHWRFQIKEVMQAQASDAATEIQTEANLLLNAIDDKHHVVALDPTGKTFSTEQLAAELERWQGLGKPLTFIVGGPRGLHSSCLDRANQSLSLSALTFPHPLVRVVLVEQLYRAHTLLINHPYHRA